MQIDNYSESCIHPVLLHDLRDDQSEEKEGDKEESEVAAAEIPLFATYHCSGKPNVSWQ